MNDKLPPIPQGYKYGGQLKDYDGEIVGRTFAPDLDDDWSGSDRSWGGMKGHIAGDSADWHIAGDSADWHIAVPETAEVPNTAVATLETPMTDAINSGEFDSFEIRYDRMHDLSEDLERKLAIARAALTKILNSVMDPRRVEHLIEEALTQTAP